MGKKYIRILTHGIIKVDLDQPNPLYQGIWGINLSLPGIFLVAKDATQFIAIYALLSNNTDRIIMQLMDLNSDSTIDVIYKPSDDPHKDKKMLEKFFTRIQESCLKLKFNFPFCKVQPKAVKTIAINFDGNIGSLENIELAQSAPFTDARIAINQFNFLGSYPLDADYADYPLDLQFSNNTFTPVPTLTDEGYLLWSILQEKEYKFLIFRNPNFNHKTKDIICNPFQPFPAKDYSDLYDKYLKLIKLDINFLTKKCLEYFKAKNFTEALVYAERALEKISLIHEQHIQEELSIAYYNVGSVYLELRHYKSAHEALKKSALLCVALGNPIRLQKVNAKIATLTEDKLQSLNLLDLPYEIHLRILNNLSIKDFASMIRTSEKSQQIFNQDMFWRERLAQDFTHSRDLNKTSRKQYKEKYLAIQSMQDEVDVNRQLEHAFSIGAEVCAEKLFKQGAIINLSVKTLQTLLKSNNEQLIKLCLKNGLDVNASVKDSMGNQISIFHLAVFKAPETITVLLKEVTPITILPALHLAVLENNLPKINSLLKDNTTKKTKDISQCSALWWAVVTNNYDVAKLLLENGFDLNDLAQSAALTRSIGHILDQLIKINAYQCFELLLQNGLPPEHFIEVKGEHWPLLVVAARYGRKDIIELLVKYGASVTMDLDDTKIKQLFRRIGPFTEAVSLSPVGLAASNNQVACLAYLLRISNNSDQICIRASQDHKDFDVHRDTPLSQAITNLSVEAVELLLKIGSNPNKTNKWNWYQRGELIDEREESILIRLLSIVSRLALLDYSIDFNQPETYPTQLKDWFNILEMLLKHQANFKAFTAGKNFIFELIEKPITMDRTTKTSFGTSFFNQEVDDSKSEAFKLAVLKMLDAHGIDLNFSDDQGKTLLHYAVSCNYFEIVQYLIAVAKVDIHQQDENHETAIFIAARNCKTKLFKYLQQVGSDIDLSNQAQETPRQLINESFSKKLSL